MTGRRRDRGAANPYAEDSKVTVALAELAQRADVVLETQKMIAEIEGELAAEKVGLLAETKLFNAAREKVLTICPEVATGFLLAGETMKVVDGRLVIVPVAP